MSNSIKGLKVKGVLDENGIKNFLITNPSTGESHVALRHGQFSFTLGEFTGTLKQCKQLVADDKVVHFADATEAPEAPEVDGLWDHVDPCALLCLFEIPAHISPLVHEALDANGWVKPDGSRDVELANKTVQDYLEKKRCN